MCPDRRRAARNRLRRGGPALDARSNRHTARRGLGRPSPAALDDHENGGVPTKALDRNLLIASWNIRAFGDLTEKWASTENDSPKRDLHSLLCIAEIVSGFDVIAIQEARDNLKALRHLIHALGPN